MQPGSKLPLAKTVDACLCLRRNGRLRTAFEDDYPFGQHSLPEAIDHHRFAKDAFVEHRRATDNYDRHERHRS